MVLVVTERGVAKRRRAPPPRVVLVLVRTVRSARGQYLGSEPVVAVGSRLLGARRERPAQLRRKLPENTHALATNRWSHSPPPAPGHGAIAGSHDASSSGIQTVRPASNPHTEPTFVGGSGADQPPHDVEASDPARAVAIP